MLSLHIGDQIAHIVHLNDYREVTVFLPTASN